MTPLEKVRAGVWALRVLDFAGLNDSPAADAIRDAMDQPWYRLTPEEQAEARRFSVALNEDES